MKTLTLPTLTPDNALHNVVVFYHSNCLDGLGAWHAFNNSFYKLDLKHLIKGTIRYEPYTYNSTDLLAVLDSHSTVSLVIFLDVALSNDIISLANSHLPLHKIIVIDHHRSTDTLMKYIIENNIATRVPIDVTYDEHLSGATLTAKYLDCTNAKYATLYKLIEDWDLWKFELPYSKELRASIGDWLFKLIKANDYEGALAEMSDIAERLRVAGAREILIDSGAFILREKQKRIAAMVKDSTLAVSARAAVAVVKLPDDLESAESYISELGNALALYAMHEHKSAEFAVGMVVNEDKERGVYKVSLRCAEDKYVDLSTLAAILGGGGHMKAAGFTVPNSHNLSELAHSLATSIDTREPIKAGPLL